MAAITVVDEFEDLRRTADEVDIDEGTELWARLGLICRGIAYLVAGALAFQVAWSTEPTVAEDALGRNLLVVLAVAFAGCALWHLGRAIGGARDELRPRRRTEQRVLSAGKALVYLGLAVATVALVSDDAGTLTPPRGPVLVGSVAAVLFVAAAWMVDRGFSKDGPRWLDTRALGPVVRSTVDAVGTVGLTARAAVVALLGYLLLRTSFDPDAEEAEGFDQVLGAFVDQPHGRWVVTAIAVGLACYGLYSWIEARYRRL